MKIRNIAQISILIGLLASTQAHCMLVAVAKKLLQKTGTGIGVGLPTAPFVISAVDGARQIAQNPEVFAPNSQPLPADHEAFYRKTVGDKVELRYAPDRDANGNAGNIGNLIVMPESVHTRDGKVSLTEALATNNTEALNTFEGILEHENGHRIHKDVYKKCAEVAAIPIATTAVAALLFKKTIPMGNTLPKAAGRFATKVLAGKGLFEANKEAVNIYAAHASRQKEIAADQTMSIKNRAPALDSLEIMDNTAFTALAQHQYPNLNKVEQQKMARKLQHDHHNSVYATHPSPTVRKKALGVHTSTNNVVGQTSNTTKL